MRRTVQGHRFPGMLPIALAFVAATAACSTSPSAPTPQPSVPGRTPQTPLPPPPPLPPASPALASLAIEDAFGIKGPNWTCERSGCWPGTGYIYEVRFVLRELSGASGVRITTVVVVNPSQRPGGTYSQATGESCWRDALNVPAGGTLDRFHTDAGSAWLSYCYVGIDSQVDISSLVLEVTFVDDVGNPGSASTTVTSFR